MAHSLSGGQSVQPIGLSILWASNTLRQKRSWDTTVYAGIRQFHKAKGFDLDSQDVARSLGQPLYELSGVKDVPFAHVDDEHSCAEEDNEDELSMDLSWSELSQDTLSTYKIFATAMYTHKVEIPVEAIPRSIHLPKEFHMAHGYRPFQAYQIEMNLGNLLTASGQLNAGGRSWMKKNPVP
ncbi:hypothetical protein B0H19DRAFT_1070961 [Mycena capillaripes]|nr:hypothetical protein B0H19DRAFT_1070961 [Mycena capillaripes]